MEFIYKEFESEANLFDKLLPGVSNIYKFLCALNQKIGDNSKLFHDIMNKVGKLNILKVLTFAFVLFNVFKQLLVLPKCLWSGEIASVLSTTNYPFHDRVQDTTAKSPQMEE